MISCATPVVVLHLYFYICNTCIGHTPVLHVKHVLHMYFTGIWITGVIHQNYDTYITYVTHVIHMWYIS